MCSLVFSRAASQDREGLGFEAVFCFNCKRFGLSSMGVGGIFPRGGNSGFFQE